MRQNLKVLELRNYLLKPKTREAFIEYFENHFVESQAALGGCVLGQFRIDGEDDRFFWVRGFADMRSRLAFLRAFYEESEIWKKFGDGANQMMLEWHDVHLLKRLNDESFDGDDLVKEKGIVAVDFYFAKNNQLDKLARVFQTNVVPFLDNKPTLWTSEMTENDFPRLPAIQDPNLLVAMTTFNDEAARQAQLNRIAELKNQTTEFTAQESALILYPTAKTFEGNARNENNSFERTLR